MDEKAESMVTEPTYSETSARKDDLHYTYSDYIKWEDDKRWELINGVPFLMSAPSRQHQSISRNLVVQLGVMLKGRPCEVFHAPFDVRLDADTSDDTVVQPDIIVICDSDKLDATGCIGAPDFIIEILSPSTKTRDKNEKFDLYRRVGVKEYWIVEPETKKVFTHVFADSDNITRIYNETDSVPVFVLSGYVINLAEVFEQ